MKDENWEEWGLADLVESLRKYADRNPLTPRDLEFLKTPLGQQGPDKSRRDKMFMMGMGRNLQRKPQGCVYYGLDNYRSTDCSKVLDIDSRKEILQRKELESRSCNKYNGTTAGIIHLCATSLPQGNFLARPLTHLLTNLKRILVCVM